MIHQTLFKFIIIDRSLYNFILKFEYVNDDVAIQCFLMSDVCVGNMELSVMCKNKKYIVLVNGFEHADRVGRDSETE